MVLLCQVQACEVAAARLAADSVSSFLSSPDSNISVMMSQPPTSSPSTNSCGKVGHSETFGKLARISGLLRMSTYANFSPQAISIWLERAEKPHCGALGLPFI